MRRRASSRSPRRRCSRLSACSRGCSGPSLFSGLSNWPPSSFGLDAAERHHLVEGDSFASAPLSTHLYSSSYSSSSTSSLRIVRLIRIVRLLEFFPPFFGVGLQLVQLGCCISPSPLISTPIVTRWVSSSYLATCFVRMSEGFLVPSTFLYASRLVHLNY